MNVKGKLVEKFETQEVSASFKKREFVIEYSENPQYPEFVKFELIQSNCDQIEPIAVGTEINVTFNLKGRKWTDPQGVVKYFNSLQAWRVEPAVAEVQSQPDAPSEGEATWLKEDFSADDDLPF
ncbi:MAG: DUF3127 domain-containing protein [Cyclobacteriaceae bacterium]|nr:DUF3127 domain-containing protein [Cyclobacteriaceae bacterium HetDA_MAG_MS6]